MQEIDKEIIQTQLEEVKGSLEILAKWLNKEKTELIRKDLIDEFFRYHRENYTRNLNKKIKEMLEI